MTCGANRCSKLPDPTAVTFLQRTRLRDDGVFKLSDRFQEFEDAF